MILFTYIYIYMILHAYCIVVVYHTHRLYPLLSGGFSETAHREQWNICGVYWWGLGFTIMSPYVIKVHHVSPYFTIFHHVSPYFSIFHHVSPMFHHVPPVGAS